MISCLPYLLTVVWYKDPVFHFVNLCMIKLILYMLFQIYIGALCTVSKDTTQNKLTCYVIWYAFNFLSYNTCIDLCCHECIYWSHWPSFEVVLLVWSTQFSKFNPSDKLPILKVTSLLNGFFHFKLSYKLVISELCDMSLYCKIIVFWVVTL